MVVCFHPLLPVAIPHLHLRVLHQMPAQFVVCGAERVLVLLQLLPSKRLLVPLPRHPAQARFRSQLLVRPHHHYPACQTHHSRPTVLPTAGLLGYRKVVLDYYRSLLTDNMMWVPRRRYVVIEEICVQLHRRAYTAVQGSCTQRRCISRPSDPTFCVSPLGSERMPGIPKHVSFYITVSSQTTVHTVFLHPL